MVSMADAIEAFLLKPAANEEPYPLDVLVDRTYKWRDIAGALHTTESGVDSEGRFCARTDGGEWRRMPMWPTGSGP